MNPILKKLLDNRNKPTFTASIIIGNSYSKLENFPSEIIETIRKKLTYKNTEAEYERMKLLGMMKMAKAMNNKRMFHGYRTQLDKLPPEFTCWLLEGNLFPTGLLYIVQETLQNVPHSTIDQRVKPEPYLILKFLKSPHSPYAFQQEMINIADNEPRGVFESCVGSGKTNIITYIIKNKEVNTLVVVPSRGLLDQMYNDLVEVLGEKKVQIIETKSLKKKLLPIRVVVINTLASLQKKGELGKLIGDVDMIIFDEFHHAGAKSYTDLNLELGHIYYRYGFTATYMRNDSRLLDMLGVLSKELYEYPPKRGISEGTITPVELKICQIRNCKPISNWQKEYAAYYCGSKLILEGVMSILQRVPKKDQVLILVDRKDSGGKVLYDYLKKLGISSSYISGDDDKEVITQTIKNFNDLKIKVLIGSTVIGEGINIRSTDHLILARGGKSEIAITQAIGRCVRKFPGKTNAYVYDFNFEGTKFLSKHSRMRMDIFKKQFDGVVSEFKL